MFSPMEHDTLFTSQRKPDVLIADGISVTEACTCQNSLNNQEALLQICLNNVKVMTEGDKCQQCQS